MTVSSTVSRRSAAKLGRAAAHKAEVEVVLVEDRRRVGTEFRVASQVPGTWRVAGRGEFGPGDPLAMAHDAAAVRILGDGFAVLVRAGERLAQAREVDLGQRFSMSGQPASASIPTTPRRAPSTRSALSSGCHRRRRRAVPMPRTTAPTAPDRTRSRHPRCTDQARMRSPRGSHTGSRTTSAWIHSPKSSTSTDRPSSAASAGRYANANERAARKP